MQQKMKEFKKHRIDVKKINNINYIVAKMINQQWKENIFGKKKNI